MRSNRISRRNFLKYDGVAAILAASYFIGRKITRDGKEGPSVISPSSNLDNRIIGQPKDTEVRLEGMISIESIREFKFDSKDVSSSRPEIFRDGHFSIFDILLHPG